MGDEEYPWQVAGLYQGESAGQLLQECSALLKPFSKPPIPAPRLFIDESDASPQSRTSSSNVSSNANTGTNTTKNYYENYPTTSSSSNSETNVTNGEPESNPQFVTLGKGIRHTSAPINNETQSSIKRPEKEHGFSYMESNPQFATLRKGLRHTSTTINNETQSATGEPEKEGIHSYNYMESNPQFATLRKGLRHTSTTINNEIQSATGEQEKEGIHGYNNMGSNPQVVTTSRRVIRHSYVPTSNQTHSSIVENRLSSRTSLFGPKPFTYLNESDLSNRLLAGKSKAESTNTIKVEQNNLDTFDRSVMEIKNGFMRKGTTDISSRTQSTVSSNSQSAYAMSSSTMRKSVCSQIVTESHSKKEVCSTSTDKHLTVDESSLFPNEKLSKRTFSMNTRRNVESSIDRLVRHFDVTLYQNYFFLEDAKTSSGKYRTPVIEDVTHKPLAIETLKNQETREHNLEVPKLPGSETKTDETTSNSSGSETNTKVTRSNSTKVLKDLVEPQQTTRKLWRDMPQVKAAGYLEKATLAERQLQESKFEVITSEASYFRSLVVLETHFALRLTNYLTKAQYKFIFGLVKKVRKVSEVLLKALSQCFEQNILMTTMGHILYDLVKDNFQIYITYCKNYPLIDKTLEEVRKEPQFEKALNNLEAEPVCQNLKLSSFLILPMQRFLRMPLLVETILKKLSPQDLEYKIWEKLLKFVKKKADECNNACGEMDDIAKQYVIIRDLAVSLKFAQGIPPLALQSSSRTLLLQDTFNILVMTETEATEVGSVRLTLLSDYLILAKPDGNKHYQVMTYCTKDKASIKCEGSSEKKRFIVLKLAANYKGEAERWFLGIANAKKCEEIMKNWLEALPQYNDDLSEDENLKIKKGDKKTVRKSTDTSQKDNKLVKAIYEFKPTKSDELELKRGELLRVKSKSDDGWCFGERVRDGKVGWFPQNFTSLVSQAEEIEHTLNQELV